IPSPTNQPAGCKFHTRCPFAIDLCKRVEPALESDGTGHDVACHRWKELVTPAAALA
ncbi:MAG: peptide ABC transporter ATP-binding protein, partial [Proteobacteria bacterium]|nr:peptide ABC transporter ATP-binding protein [Pseudomonadota bacterium]